MNETDQKYYEEMNELFATKGWEHIQKIVDQDLKSMEAIYNEGDEKEIFRMQGHRRVLLWMKQYKDQIEAEYQMALQHIAEDEEDANL